MGSHGQEGHLPKRLTNPLPPTSPRRLCCHQGWPNVDSAFARARSKAMRHARPVVFTAILLVRSYSGLLGGNRPINSLGSQSKALPWYHDQFKHSSMCVCVCMCVALCSVLWQFLFHLKKRPVARTLYSQQPSPADWYTSTLRAHTQSKSSTTVLIAALLSNVAPLLLFASS